MSWPQGKKLKPFLCLLKILSVNPPFYHGLTKELLCAELHRAFPYYELSFLETIVNDFYEAGLSLKQICALKRYLWNDEYQEETERIASPSLFHFLKKEHLLSALKNKFIYPSILSIDEYMRAENRFANSILHGAEHRYEKMMTHWKGSADRLRLLRDGGEAKRKLNRFLATSSFLPAYNCFTELPSDSFKLHAEHYGAYGISFRKQTLLSPDRHRVYRRVHGRPDLKTLRNVLPIHYCSASSSTSPWLLIEHLCRDDISEELRRQVVSDLVLTKPIDESLLSPENIFSVIFEREWRYVSFEKVFDFDIKMLERVLVSKSDYVKYIANEQSDPILREILEIAPAGKILKI